MVGGPRHPDGRHIRKKRKVTREQIERASLKLQAAMKETQTKGRLKLLMRRVLQHDMGHGDSMLVMVVCDPETEEGARMGTTIKLDSNPIRYLGPYTFSMAETFITDSAHILDCHRDHYIADLEVI